ncbi:MAG: imidazole glycerol phosphate synthase subunit HisH [Alphaproteobacteria bacterium]|nr:imidazole glycerol phosphate synthase subunit HisH [Alphaproteobacteria bacterium]
MNVAIIDYGSGNLRSAAKAFERAARESGIEATIDLCTTPDDLANADRIVLPGVGAFGDCRRGLERLPGMVDALNRTVIERGRPFLGICVGMQLMASVGREHGDHPGLDWIPGEVVAIEPAADAAPEDGVPGGLRVPHMGWNDLAFRLPAHPVLTGIASGSHVYFVHSYRMKCREARHVLASIEYGCRVSAMIGRDNMVGTQFHPEKSQATGLQLIANFLRWRP